MANCKIPRLNGDINFGLPVLAVLGIINSLWVSTYFIEAMDTVFGITDWQRDDNLIGPMLNTYYLLCLSATVMLYYGFKNNDKKIIHYWFLLKYIECGIAITGLTLYATRYRYRWPFILVAIPILSSSWAIIRTINKGFRKLSEELEHVSILNVSKNFEHPYQNQESPPPYEAVENADGN